MGPVFAFHGLMKVIIILFCFFLLPFELWASSESLLFKDSSGESLKIKMTEYVNSNGVKEVRIDAGGLPAFERLNPVLAFGRDLDDNQKIDTWFFLTKNGVEVIEREGLDPLGRDVLPAIFAEKHKTSAGAYVSSITNSILSFLLLSASETKKTENQYIKDWIDLEELRIRFENDLKAGTLSNDEVRFHYELMSLGYSNLASTMEGFAKRDFWGWAGADIALWVTGSVVIKWAGNLLVKAGVALSETAVVTAIKDEMSAFFGKHTEVIKEKMNAVSKKLSAFKNKAAGAKAEVSVLLTRSNFHRALSSSLISSVTKKRLLNVVKKSVKWPKLVANAALSEWKYISMSTGIQISAETAARWDEIYDPSPLTMAHNLFSNPEFLQNVGFMTADTVLMTGVSKNLATTKARYMASGLVALTNSSTVNLVIKQSDNYKRIALDTGWEAVVGNGLVQLDLKALEFFEKMSHKKNNPRFRLLGYAVVLVNQGTGYFMYSKTTTALHGKDSVKHREENTEVRLVPVLAEGNN